MVGTHAFNYVVLGKGWKGYPTAFIPFAASNWYTITIANVNWFNSGQGSIDVTSQFTLGDQGGDGFAISNQVDDTKAMVGHCIRLTVTATLRS